MRGVLDPVQHVVQRRRDVVDVLRIDRGDEGLVQAGENLVNDLVALVLQHADFGGGARQPRIAVAHALQQQPGCFRDDLHLLEKQVVKLLLAWQ